MDEDIMIRTLIAQRAKILGFIGSIVRRADLAEDIFQDVCVLAVEKCKSIENEAHLLNWLRTTARLRSLNLLRKRQERQISLDDGLLAVLETAWQEEDKTDSARMAEALRHCLDSLSPAARDLIHRRYVDDVDYPSLAELMKRPVNSLYVTFSRIYATLSKCVSQRLALEGDGHG